MTRDEKKKKEKIILILSLGCLALLGVFLVFCFVSGRIQSLVFPVGTSILLALYWGIADILPVLWAKIFEGKNEMQRQAYYMYALIDFAGLAGLVYFVVDLESTTGAIIYAISIFLKRNFRDKFDGKEETESEGAEIQTDVPEELSAEQSGAEFENVEMQTDVSEDTSGKQKDQEE